MRSLTRFVRAQRGASLAAGAVVTFLLVLFFSLAFGWVNPLASVAALFLAGLLGGYVTGPGARRGATAAFIGALVGGALAVAGLIVIITSGIYPLPFVPENPSALEVAGLVAAAVLPALFFATVGGMIGGILRERRERALAPPSSLAVTRCEHCGAPLPSEAVYCPQCGVRRL